ncbi:DUF4150 domain-containing protein [Aliivibrio fischeri]|uniref:DUF4150 domain-containing protein n=1 Tax=Aliivibrio fischeri TaxID=668 RepID=UPI0012DA09A0|nr:DUF4150 domain-containing protein [Aliivibrio fischeri]MUJ39059.1 DUF4150 domain-containing protein [Aliivibrio fischeri]
MGVTVAANGLSVVHQGSGGEANATLPDVCLTKVGKPIVPIPYGNNAKSADLAKGTTTITMDGGNPVAIKGSTFSKSTGDAGGDKKGVASGTIEAEAEFISASPTVKFEGKGVCRLSDQMTMNKANTMCLGGAQNPSVSVTAEEEGTYTVDITCKYPNGLAYANAPFELKDSQGGILGGGILDSNGKASCSGLPPSECSLILKESNDSYSPIASLIANQPSELYEDPQDFCTFIAGRRAPFWETKIGVNSDWGILISPSLSDDDFKNMVFEQSRLLSPFSISLNHSNDFANAFISALFHIQEDRETLQKYESLLELLFEQVHENGNILRILFQADITEPPAELLAQLRYLGSGNTANYIQTMLWTMINKQICSHLDELITALNERLDYILLQAQTHSFSGIEEGINNYKNGLNILSRSLPDIFGQILEKTNDKLLSISAMSVGAIVSITGTTGFTTNSGEINAVVYTKANNIHRPSIVTFDDIFSD